MFKGLNILKRKRERKHQVFRKGSIRSTKSSVNYKINRSKKSKFLKSSTTNVDNTSLSNLDELTSELQRLNLKKLEASKTDKLSQFLHDQIIGKDEIFRGPVGWRKCVYVDNTASGKPLQMIEDFIRNTVLPFYANTHTTTSHTALMMTAYRNEARRCVREAVGAREEDVVLFCGSGCTGAVHKLIHCLNIKKDEKPIVIVGPYEHHSNLLPWRETGAKMINIPEDKSGSLDVNILQQKLRKIVSKSKNKKSRIFGCFSAGSNVTGTTSDDVKITKLMHEFGGFCFWDYAAAAPHVKIEMNPCASNLNNTTSSRITFKDALYFSGHKFPGGPQTTGVLVLKRFLFRNPVPHNGGGGTVFFVTPERHAYLQDKEEAEEGGTPAIIESIRLGLVMSLHQSIGAENIICREAYFTKKAISIWSQTPGLIILGNTDKMRLPIISFVIQHQESGFQLHQNFVVALLNDLFGIQCRGGCMCAGPYAQVLLGINLKLAEEFERVLSSEVCPQFDGNNKPKSYFEMIYRPGFTRVSFPFEASHEEVDFVIEAVQMVAHFGWKLLTKYKVCPKTGQFKYYTNTPNENERKILPSIRRFNPLSLHNWESNSRTHNRERINTKDENSISTNLKFVPDFSTILRMASEIFDSIQVSTERLPVKALEPKLNVGSVHLRWFMLPSDAANYLCKLWNGDKAKKGSYGKFHIKVVTNRYNSQNESNTQLKCLVPSYYNDSIPFQLQRMWTPVQSVQNRREQFYTHL